MQDTRESEMSEGRSGPMAAGNNSKLNPADGFEGMNYEQRRENYCPRRQPSSRSDAGNPSGTDDRGEKRNP